jgi:predicted small secreted protein
MKFIQRILSCLAVLGMMSMFLAGCNTMEGMGEDIEKGGESIQDAAD